MERLSSKVSVRQLSWFFLAICPLSKLLILPSMVYYVSLNDAYLAVLMFGLIDLALLFMMTKIMSATNKSVTEILKECVGEIGCKVVVGAYGLLLIFKALVLTFEESLLSLSILYEGTTNLLAIIPLFAILLYVGFATTNSTFRTVELFAPFVLVALAFITFLSVTATDLSGVFPVLEYGASPILKSLYGFSFWFGDFIILIPLLNDVRMQKNFRKKIIGSYAINVAIVVVLYIIVLGIFGMLAPRQLFFIAKISKYSVTFSNLGRIDFVFMCVLVLGMILWSVVMFALGVKLLAYSLGTKKLFVTLFFTVGGFIYVALTYKNIQLTLNFATNILSPFAIVMQYILPFGILIMQKVLAKRQKKLEKIKEVSK